MGHVTTSRPRLHILCDIIAHVDKHCGSPHLTSMKETLIMLE